MSKEKKRIQNVHFDSIDDLLRFLPEDELLMVQALRTLVYDCVPKVKEKLGFNVPFFHLHSALCFIWPGSVDWAGKANPGRVEFGFTKGYLLSDRRGYLEHGNRTQMFSRRFYALSEINHEVLVELLFEAAEINEQKALEQSRKIKKKG